MDTSIFEELRSLLTTGQWPQAVNPLLICNPNIEQEKEGRARDILNLYIDKRVKGKKLLDIGCGEGHLAKIAVAEFDAKSAVAYDNVSYEWKQSTNELKFTNNLEEVTSSGPYDIITIYDVLDHATNPVEVLTMAKSVLSPTGTIHLHCHPWISRHGGHYYQQINKAFIHLVFTQDELQSMGYQPTTDVQRVIAPVKTYTAWIESAGLKVKSQNVSRTPVDEIFYKVDILKQRLPVIIIGKFPKYQMEQSFHDYALAL